jgi:hypothetical protein
VQLGNWLILPSIFFAKTFYEPVISEVSYFIINLLKTVYRRRSTKDDSKATTTAS